MLPLWYTIFNLGVDYLVLPLWYTIFNLGVDYLVLPLWYTIFNLSVQFFPRSRWKMPLALRSAVLIISSRAAGPLWFSSWKASPFYYFFLYISKKWEYYKICVNLFNLSFKSFITENIPSVSYSWSLLPVVFLLILYSVLAWCLGKFSQSCFHTGRGGCIVWMHHQSHYHYFFPRWQQVELMSPFIIIINIFICGHMNGTMGILHKYGKYGRVWFMPLRTLKLKLN